MVFAIAIACVSLSCEPVPIFAGWYFTEQECVRAAVAAMESWRPTVGIYELSCIRRTEI